MGASNSENKNIKFYSLKAKVSDTDTPNFSLTEKINGGWAITGTFNTINGRIKGAEIKEKEYQGAKFNTFILTIDDETEVSKVELTHNAITHSLINILASNCNSLDNYSLQVYKKQTKGTDNKMYWNGGIAVKVNGSSEMQKWHIDPQSAPKKEPVMLADGTQLMQLGKKVWNHDKERVFWEQVFINKVQSNYKAPTPSNTNAADNSGVTKNDNPNQNIVTPADENLDDLPF